MSRVTNKPRYIPLMPSVARMVRIAVKVPVYSGMFLWMYLPRVGPCTCIRLRTTSNGNTTDLAARLEAEERYCGVFEGDHHLRVRPDAFDADFHVAVVASHSLRLVDTPRPHHAGSVQSVELIAEESGRTRRRRFALPPE